MHINKQKKYLDKSTIHIKVVEYMRRTISTSKDESMAEFSDTAQEFIVSELLEEKVMEVLPMACWDHDKYLNHDQSILDELDALTLMIFKAYREIITYDVEGLKSKVDQAKKHFKETRDFASSFDKLYLQLHELFYFNLVILRESREEDDWCIKEPPFDLVTDFTNRDVGIKTTPPSINKVYDCYSICKQKSKSIRDVYCLEKRRPDYIRLVK
jgi:hypothetical protein